jgi:ankyrin repeat protein
MKSVYRLFRMKAQVVLFVVTILGAGPAVAAEIHDAVRSGDVAAVKALLDQTPALVNLKDESGQTPLHWAAQGRNPALVPLLVERGADVKAADNRGISPLHLLAHGGNLAGMTLLLDKGADVNLKAADGAAPLEFAALARQLEAIRLLAARKANLESANGYGRTPLVVAAREMRGAAVIGALLDLGAKVDASDKYGATALTLAAWRGSADVVSLLLARGASVPVNSDRGRALLESAVSTGLADLFLRMVEKGADLPIAPAPNSTLLHRAAEGGAVPIVAALVERRFDVNRADANGWTPLHFAADMGRTEVVTFLLGKGADPNARTVIGQSAFNLAQDNNDAPTAALLAGKGADQSAPRFPDLRGPYLGQTPPGRTPEVFAPGLVSARFGLHSTVVFSPDGTEAFWSLMIPPRTVGYSTGRTMASRLVNGRWTYPQQAVFDGVPLDDVPFFHPDGQRLYDMADRPIPSVQSAGGEHIWVWQKTGSGWARPRPLDATVNRLPLHWQFSVDRAGTLYFTSTWAGARGIFTSRLVNGAHADPVPLESALGPDAQFPFIAPDGSYLLFTRGMQDLCVSFRDAGGRWSKPVSLGSEFNGVLPIVSPDGKYLFFGRNQRVYWVDARVIEERRPKQP